MSDYVTKTNLLSALGRFKENADNLYETKADASDLKDALSAIDHRVENLEQPKGGYVVENYKDGSITPSGKGKWCVVEGVEGVSRVENQLQNITSASGASWGNGTYSYADGTITINCNATESTVNAKVCDLNFSTVSGHSYLFYAPYLSSYFSAYSLDGGFPINAITQVNFNATIQLRCYKYGGFANVVTYTSPILVRDLTVYFAGDPSVNVSSLTIADIQKDYPHLLTPSEYGTRIVDWTGNGVRAEGVNIWDEEWELGGINATTGATYDNNQRIRSKNYIRMLSNADYYFYLGIGSLAVFACYDANHNFLGDIGYNAENSVIHTPVGTVYGKFQLSQYYGTTYKHDVTIARGSTAVTYHPYMTDTLTLPSPVTLRSAGSVADEVELNVEVGGVAKKRTTERVKSVVYDGSSDENWQLYGSAQRFYIQKADQKINSGSTVANLTCDKLMVTRKDWVDQYDKAVGVEYRSFVLRIDSTITTVEQLRTWLAQNPVTINYELDTPVVTLSDPILDNTLLTEAGGRMATVQTGTVVDGSFDIGFINL